MKGILERLSEVNAIRSDEVFNMPVASTPLWRFAFGLSGEAAEVLQDIRKMEEGRTDVSNERLGAELADVVIYAELIASKLDINLGAAIKAKYNKVSDKFGHWSKL